MTKERKRERWAGEEGRTTGRELKAWGAREGQKKMKRESRETMHSAVDNYSRKLADTETS